MLKTALQPRTRGLCGRIKCCLAPATPQVPNSLKSSVLNIPDALRVRKSSLRANNNYRGKYVNDDLDASSFEAHCLVLPGLLQDFTYLKLSTSVTQRQRCKVQSNISVVTCDRDLHLAKLT